MSVNGRRSMFNTDVPTYAAAIELGINYNFALDKGVWGIAINVSVCLFVCLFSCVSEKLHVQISPNFAHVTWGRGSVFLWQ